MSGMIIDGLEFVEFEYVKPPVTCVAISAKGDVSVGKLVKEALGGRVRLMWTKDGAKIAVSASDDARKGLKVTGAGTTSSRAIAEELTNIGIPLPAKYAMTKRDDALWIGELLPFEPARCRPASATKKPRKSDLAAMMPKGGTF